MRACAHQTPRNGRAHASPYYWEAHSFRPLVGRLSPDLGKLISFLWASEKMRELFKRRNEFQLNDSAEFYFSEVDRLSQPGYMPTTDDILRSRVRTTGIVQSDFKIKTMNFAM
jgi:guanine nucleotide-binding protein G(i) subunit alpha